MRPQANIHLVWLEECGNHLRDLVEQRSHLCRLLAGEFPEVQAVSYGFDDQRSNTERPGAVFDNPVLGVMNVSAWKILLTSSQLTRITIHILLAPDTGLPVVDVADN